MSDSKRSSPYFWVTWLPALLSGDSHCRYAAWYKGHHKYAKVPQSADDESKMREHMRVHEQGLQDVAREYAGYDVSLEDNNAFVVKGQRADVGGKIDLIAIDGDHGDVVDIKGGRPYDKHKWQVIFYMLFGVPRIAHAARLAGHLVGKVVYLGRNTVEITPSEAEKGRKPFVSLLTELSASTPPPAAPSYRECLYCDIAHCAYRHQPAPEPDAPAPGF
jgi:hypothetical protein